LSAAVREISRVMRSFVLKFLVRNVRGLEVVQPSILQ